MKIDLMKRDLPVEQGTGIGVEETAQVAGARLRESFGAMSYGTNVNPTELKAQDLNYESFKKSERSAAFDIANRSLNEVKDKVREFNKDFPLQAFFPPYATFPKPEGFNPKNFGGKDEAFNAWKMAVVEWVEDVKQDIAKQLFADFAE